MSSEWKCQPSKYLVGNVQNNLTHIKQTNNGWPVQDNLNKTLWAHYGKFGLTAAVKEPRDSLSVKSFAWVFFLSHCTLYHFIPTSALPVISAWAHVYVHEIHITFL